MTVKSSVTSTSRIAAGWGAVVFAALACGCGKPPYELAEARGVVTVEGKPFTTGKVMFAPAAKGDDHRAGRAAFGVLGPDGSFELSTYEPGDGAVVGRHSVTLISIPPAESTPPGAAPQFSRVFYPQPVEVQAGATNEFKIEFSRDDVARYSRKLD